jgi:hypothetical protein
MSDVAAPFICVYVVSSVGRYVDWLQLGYDDVGGGILHIAELSKCADCMT